MEQSVQKSYYNVAREHKFAFSNASKGPQVVLSASYCELSSNVFYSQSSSQVVLQNMSPYLKIFYKIFYKIFHIEFTRFLGIACTLIFLSDTLSWQRPYSSRDERYNLNLNDSINCSAIADRDVSMHKGITYVRSQTTDTVDGIVLKFQLQAFSSNAC